MTTRAAALGGAVPPWTLAVGAMLSVQLHYGVSFDLIDTVGAAGRRVTASEPT